MTQSAFSRLYQAVGDSDRLLADYDNVLSDLFQNPFWESGATELHRVLKSKVSTAQNRLRR
jgi:hypothetical protein